MSSTHSNHVSAAPQFAENVAAPTATIEEEDFQFFDVQVEDPRDVEGDVDSDLQSQPPSELERLPMTAERSTLVRVATSGSNISTAIVKPDPRWTNGLT